MLAGQAAVGWLVALPPGAARTPCALAEMAAMGVLGILGNYGLAQAFRSAPVATWPVRVHRLDLGLAVRRRPVRGLPPTSFWAGAAVIVGAGLYTLRSG